MNASYQVCFECKQEYPTAADLLDAWNAALAGFGLEPESDVEQVVTCPACVHDFVFPPAACQCGSYYQVGCYGDYMPEVCPVHDRRRVA